MLTDPTDREAVVRDLVRTYNAHAYADPWDAVEDYRQVQRYTANHPNQGSSAVSSALGLPRSRIRLWVDGGGKPDPARAIETADVNGWLVESWDDDHARGLNVLSAWLLSSGSIRGDWWRPRWVVDTDEDAKRLLDAASDGNVSLTLARTDDDHTTEYVPDVDASVLGRLLSLWTGLQGDKTPEVVQFPRYPQYAPDEIAREFATTYIHLRGTVRTDKGDPFIQIQAQRTDEFRRELIRLLRRIADTPTDIRGDAWPVRITGGTAEMLLPG